MKNLLERHQNPTDFSMYLKYLTVILNTKEKIKSFFKNEYFSKKVFCKF